MPNIVFSYFICHLFYDDLFITICFSMTQDYEYASYNPVAYDLANHFCEMVANYHSDQPHVLDYTKYPSKLIVHIIYSFHYILQCFILLHTLCVFY